MDQPPCHVDGFGPLSVVRPTSVDELGEVVRRASAEGTALYPVGGRTQLALGNPPIKAGAAVDMCGLEQVIDFPARDMTITVQAGIGMTRLTTMLAVEGLRLPIDVPNAERATLGGIIATNTSGPRRYGYGTLRDYVIGISAVNDDGAEFKAGGRVVKNVAGYDLCKLLVGALGTLGIITQVTLKLRPLPEEHALISFGCEADALEGVLAALHGTRSRPVCIELLNRPAAAVVFRRAGLEVPDAPWVVVVGYEGNAAAVRWQVQQQIQEAGAARGLEARVGFCSHALWEALQDGADESATRFAAPPAAWLALKANMLSSALAAFCCAADRDADRPMVQAHAGNGIVLGCWPAMTQDRATALRAAWRAQAERGQGGVVVTSCPPAWKRSVPVWDAIAAGWLMRAVKEQFDPRRIFNPGRFVEGI